MKGDKGKVKTKKSEPKDSSFFAFHLALFHLSLALARNFTIAHGGKINDGWNIKNGKEHKDGCGHDVQGCHCESRRFGGTKQSRFGCIRVGIATGRAARPSQ